MLDLTMRDEGEVTVVVIEGKLTTTTSPQAEEFLAQLVDEGASSICLNLEHLDFISSTGLRIILATGKKLSSAGGKLAMCGANPTVQEVLKISGFSTMFPVFDAEDEALGSF